MWECKNWRNKLNTNDRSRQIDFGVDEFLCEEIQIIPVFDINLYKIDINIVRGASE